MFTSLALTKMDSNNIANYLMLPVLFGLIYFNIMYYYRTSASMELNLQNARSSSATLMGEENVINLNNKSFVNEDKKENLEEVFSNDNEKMLNEKDYFKTIDQLSLVFCDTLILLALIQMVANFKYCKQQQQQQSNNVQFVQAY